jgi:hypothetical protein
VRYVLSDAFLSERRVLELSGSEEEFAAIRLLASCGLRGDVARNLVAAHGPAHCTRYANALPYQKNLRNPAGWLRRAIEEGFELPNTSSRQRHSARTVLFSEEHEEARTLVRPDRVIPREDDENATEVLQLEPVEPPASDSKAQQAWANLVEALIALHGRDSLPPWFGDFEGGELEGSTITILVPNNFAANHLKENFGEDLVHLWRERSGDEEAVLQVTTDLSSGVRAQLYVDA